MQRQTPEGEAGRTEKPESSARRLAGPSRLMLCRPRANFPPQLSPTPSASPSLNLDV